MIPVVCEKSSESKLGFWHRRVESSLNILSNTLAHEFAVWMARTVNERESHLGRMRQGRSGSNKGAQRPSQDRRNGASKLTGYETVPSRTAISSALG